MPSLLLTNSVSPQKPQAISEQVFRRPKVLPEIKKCQSIDAAARTKLHQASLQSNSDLVSTLIHIACSVVENPKHWYQPIWRSICLHNKHKQVLSSSWDGQLFGHKRHRPKIGGELGPHLTQCGLSQGQPPYQVASWTICVPSFILIHPAIWPQYTNVTDRQDNGPIP